MTRHVRIPFLIAVVLALCAVPASAATPAYKDARQPVNKRVADLLSRMTIEEKVGQMTQTERATVDADPRKITPRVPRLDPLGRRLDADAEHR